MRRRKGRSRLYCLECLTAGGIQVFRLAIENSKETYRARKGKPYCDTLVITFQFASMFPIDHTLTDTQTRARLLDRALLFEDR